MAFERSKQDQVVKLPEIPASVTVRGVAVCACSKSQAINMD